MPTNAEARGQAADTVALAALDLPKWLRRAPLVPCRRLPPELLAALSCPECSARQRRAEQYWCCPDGHGRLIPEPLLLERVEAVHARLRRRRKPIKWPRTAAAALRFHLRLTRLLARRGLAERDLYPESEPCQTRPRP